MSEVQRARVRRYPEKKVRMLSYFTELLREYKYLLIVDAYKTRTVLLNEIRFLEEELNFKVRGGKNNILRLAMRRVYPQTVEVAEEFLQGQNLFIFTNENPVELAYKLGKFELEVEASPGDLATEDIVIPAGNTGLPPGPIISLFSSANVPTKIVGGSIHVAKDTVVARKGDRISMNLANLLGKLGIKPIKIRLSFKAAIDLEGAVAIPGEFLKPEKVDEFVEELKEARGNAFKLSIELGIPTEENVTILLARASSQAISLSEEISYVSWENAEKILARAEARARKLAKLLGLSEEAG